MSRLAVVIACIAIAFAAIGCQSSDDGDGDPISVTELLATEPSGTVMVRGLFFDDGSEARLCAVLAESFPPQCVQESVPIANPEAVEVDIARSGSVRWSDQPVVLVGSLVDGRLVVDE